MNPDPKLPALEGMSAGQARVAVKIATAAGLNLSRAAALLLAHRQRPLRTNERAEFDQILARLNESLLQVKATSKTKPRPAAQPAALARLAPLLRAIAQDSADRRASGEARKSAALAGDLRLVTDQSRLGDYLRRSRSAEAAAGNALYRNTESTRSTAR